MTTSRRAVIRSAVGIGGLTAAAAAAPDPASAATATTLDWIVATDTAYGADPTGAEDSAAAINAALAATPVGGICYLPAGTYQTSAPLVVPPRVTLLGSHAGHTDLTACAIQPSSAFAGLALAATSTDAATTIEAVVVLLDQTSGGYSAASFEQRLVNFCIDGTNLPSTGSVNGIQAVGYVHGAYVEGIGIFNVSGRGICGLSRNAGNPYSWRMSRVCVNAPKGPYGYNVANFTDSLYEDCEAIGCSKGSGWYIAGDGNSQFTNCRAEWSGHHGFEVHSASVSSYVFTGCTTDRNGYNGMYIVDSGGVGPILVNGCIFNRDGRNDGAGGNGFAGIAVSGSTSPIVISDCVTGVHADDGGKNAQSPQYGISVTDAAYVCVNGGFYWGETAGWYDGGGNTVLRRGPNVGEATGPSTAQVLSLQNGWGTDNGSQLSIGLNAADQTGLTIANTSTNVNQPLMLLVAGSSGSDALIKSRVAGDGASRVIFSANGQLSLGNGTAGTDASWGRLGAAEIGSLDSDLVAGLAGKGLKVKEGADAKMGTLTLDGATAVTVATTAVTANSRIFLTVQAPGGTAAGIAYVTARTAGASFSVKGAAGDTSTVAWLIVEPA
jgi:pectate lyase-like protein